MKSHDMHKKSQIGEVEVSTLSLSSGMGGPVLGTTSREAQLADGLEMALERLQRCLIGRVAIPEMEMLEMSLRCLFGLADQFYTALLPELTLTMAQVPLSTKPTDAQVRFTTAVEVKLLLQDVETILERSLSFCQLLLSVTTSMLAALDRSCSIYGAARIKKRLQQEGEDEERTDNIAAITASHIAASTHYQWMQAIRVVTEHVQGWQDMNTTRLPFAHVFGEQHPLQTTLLQLDTTIQLALDSLQYLFGTILPEFHTVALGDDATVALHMLNMMQYTDVLQTYFALLQETFDLVTRHYDREAGLQSSQP